MNYYLLLIYTALGGLSITAVALLWSLYKSYQYFKAPKLNLAGPHRYPFFGSFFEFWWNKNRFYDWLVDCSRKYDGNDVIYFSLPSQPPYIVALDPDVVKHVLNDNMKNYTREPVYAIMGELLGKGIFNTDNENWKNQRKIASHMFNAKKLNNKAYNTFIDCTDILVKRIDKHIENNESFDLKDLFFRTSMDSICKIAFDYDVGSMTSEEKPEFAKAIDWCTNYLFYRLLNPLWKIKKIANLKDEDDYKTKIDLLNNLCHDIISKKKEDEDYSGDDILSMFMARGYMDEEYLRDVVFSFILAGRDTTASTLSWLFYELIKNPDIESATRERLDKVDINISTAKEYRELDVINNAFMETLRMHPPVAVGMKFSTEDDVTPSGSHIPKDSMIIYSPYIFGKSGKIWGNDYDNFKPDRWEDNKVDNYKFLAFNAGPRICLGRFFAKLEVQVIVANLLKKYKFEPVNSNNFHLKHSLGITSSLEGELRVKATHI